jgi:hypothetical protein
VLDEVLVLAFVQAMQTRGEAIGRAVGDRDAFADVARREHAQQWAEELGLVRRATARHSELDTRAHQARVVWIEARFD